MPNLRTCPQTWKVCIRAQTAVSNSHQIVDLLYTWTECMEYEDLLHPTRAGTAHAHRVNVAFHTRLRLVHHLSYPSLRCLEWCILHMEPMPDHDREVLDRKDADKRRRDKREGRSFLATDLPFVLES